ncbi:MAG: DUF4313 domain-containing protein [Anaerolineae bacterium]|nr:DUF4313 domain-containing protein [Anaerolineae bacterium]MCZ2113552.1 DUF4313 domain-containing protein [Anaerolineae bacterium]GIK44893.1 MAG: hypothetical protein BroJett012_07960 [Betaproteobacteria bacterium]
MPKIGEIKALGHEIELMAVRYGNGRPAIVMADKEDGLPFGNLSTNLPDVHLGQNEIFIKTWSENNSLRQPALDSGLFRDTGRRVPVGHAEAEVWEMTFSFPR